MLSYRPFLAAIVLALWMPAAAQAAVISQTENFGPVSLADTDSIDTVTFNQFDSSLGTLDLFRITLEATITGATGQTPSGSAYRSLAFDLTPPLGSGLSILYEDELVTSIAAEPQTRSGTLVLDADLASVVETVLLAYFTGLGTFDLNLMGVLTDDINFAGNWNISQLSGFAEGLVTVEYHYSEASEPESSEASEPESIEVPEPAVLGLLGIGLLGLGLVAHRRRRVA